MRTGQRLAHRAVTNVNNCPILPGHASPSSRSASHPVLDATTPVGAGNSAVVVDVPRWGALLSPCVPNLVPIPGITGSAHCAVRPLKGPRDHRVAPPTRCATPAGRPTRVHRRRRELARGDSGRARATELSRVAGHRRHAVALAPAPHRRALDPTTATAGPAIDLSGDSPTRTASRSRKSNLALPPHPRRTERARPHHRSVNYLPDPQGRRNRPRTHTLQSHLVAVPRSQGAVACDFATIDSVTLRRFYLLFFIDIATRTVYFAGITGHPSTRAPRPHRHLEPPPAREARRRLHRSLQHAPAPPFTRPATTRRHRRTRPARSTPPNRESRPL